MNRKELIRHLRILFVAAILDGVLMVVLGESDVIPNGIWAGLQDSNAEFIATSVAILLTIAAAFAGIKWMGGKLEIRPAGSSDEDALSLYRRWSIWRLLLWDFVLVVDIAVYYLTLSSTGALSAAIMLLLIVVFCWTGDEKLAVFMDEVKEEIEDIEEAAQREELPGELAEQIKKQEKRETQKK